MSEWSSFEKHSFGPWTVLVAPGQDVHVLETLVPELAYRIEKEGTAICPPGRHRLDRLQLRLGGGVADEVQNVAIKTYGTQAAWRDRVAHRQGSKAERAFCNALTLYAHGVGTPAPLAVAERWEGERLRESRLLTAYVEGLTDFRAELNRRYMEAPWCEPLMALLQCVADAVRALHDAGLLHRDLGNQNIALRAARPGSPVPWDVFFMDLNRAQRVAHPTDAQRGADMARLDLPSDLRRVFFAMYAHGYRPSEAFLKAEAKTRAAFARHTALRPFRHPFREAKIRRAEAAERAATHRAAPPRGRDIWLWDDRSAQPIPAYSGKDRRRLLPATNLAAAASAVLRRGLAIHREFKRLQAESFSMPVEMKNAIGLALDPVPATWARQRQELEALQGPAMHLPLLLRLHHHQGPDAWHWTLDQALALHRQGHPITLALLQDRRAVTDPKGWRQMVTLAFDRAHTFAEAFEIGHAVNRCKWGVWDYREYADLLIPVRASRIQYPDATVFGPACIDFEPLAMLGVLHQIPAPLPFDALSHHLYVDRRGAPENTQHGAFDAVAKCALLRAIARVAGFAHDRIAITEVNWPLARTGVYSPVTSPYETLDPRQNDPSVSEETYAAYMARYLLLTLASGHISRVHWWRLAARGFGLIDDSTALWRRRPAFYALQTLLREIGHATYDGSGLRLNPDEATRTLRFTRPSAPPLLVRWSLDGAPEYLPQTAAPGAPP